MNEFFLMTRASAVRFPNLSSPQSNSCTDVTTQLRPQCPSTSSG
jgi:hypothetical protein